MRRLSRTFPVGFLTLLLSSTGALTQAAKSNARTEPLKQREVVQASPAVREQQARIKRLLPSEAQRKVIRIVPGFEEEVMKLPRNGNVGQLAASEISKAFPRATPQEKDVLSFHLVSEALDRLHAENQGDLSQQEQLRLQLAMDRLSKAMSTLSNILKKTSDIQDSIVQNIK